MIELKVQCDCGQKYKFDVEPVNGQMPFRVSCPSCGSEGTDKANWLLQVQAPAPVMAAVAPPPVPGQLRLNAAAAPAVSAAPPPVAAGQRYAGMPGTRPPMAGPPPAPRPVETTTNIGLGILGALVGAAIGAALMYGFYAMAGVRFPLLGTGVGALTGLGARILYRGTDSVLGAISGGIAAVAVVGALYLIYGEFPIFNIISVLVSISIAYRVAS